MSALSSDSRDLTPFASGRRWLGRVAAAWRNRPGLAQLARMDERALGDIGLTSSDVRDALAHHWWEDPTAMLDGRRQARRGDRSSAPASRDQAFRVPPTARPPRQLL